MADIFDKYRDATDEIAVPVSESAGKAERQPMLRKKERKIFKALAKTLRKQNKLMKQEAERLQAKEETIVETATKDTDKSKRDNGARGFLSKLGDAICKAVPKLLTTLATLAFGYLVNTRFTRKAPQIT